jgi:hypothetical protein
MDIKRKVELAVRSIEMISQHDDADYAVRDAALKKLEGVIAAERQGALARVQDAIAKELGAPT